MSPPEHNDHSTSENGSGAVRRGQRAAATFDAQLRRRERDERDELLTASWSTGLPDGNASTDAALRSELESLRAFRSAVLQSRSWRFLQLLRRLVGREW